MLADGGVCFAWAYCKASGLSRPFGLVDGEAGLLERTANGQLWESWSLPMDSDGVLCSFIIKKEGDFEY